MLQVLYFVHRILDVRDVRVDQFELPGNLRARLCRFRASIPETVGQAVLALVYAVHLVTETFIESFSRRQPIFDVGNGRGVHGSFQRSDLVLHPRRVDVVISYSPNETRAAGQDGDASDDGFHISHSRSHFRRRSHSRKS